MMPQSRYLNKMATKTIKEKRAKFLTLLKERGGKKTTSKEMHSLITELSGELAKHFVTKVETEVSVKNLESAITNKLIDFLTTKKLKLEEPDWYKAPPRTLKFAGNLKAELDPSWVTQMGTIMSVFLAELLRFLTKLSKGTFLVMMAPQHYVTPQQVILINAKTGQPIRPEEMGSGVVNNYAGASAAGGPTAVGIRGATSIVDGTVSVTTAGTRVQMPDVPCSRVMIQSHPANGDLGTAGATIVVGGGGVIADPNTRRGLALFSTQWQEFRVDNLRRLYLDSTENGGKINYIAEV